MQFHQAALGLGLEFGELGGQGAVQARGLGPARGGLLQARLESAHGLQGLVGVAQGGLEVGIDAGEVVGFFLPKGLEQGEDEIPGL
jgi:hypothetical protein